ncbi:hypothetical protein NBRC116188_10990 [Oceaniserpentilla sp. 4NH20-0058]|uniref:DUF4334 domain-containing protein n=1 Tax=Oceaniserpentilla sp. 4NH20-0058 TaxID=3127660 RepID=UPI0031064FE0
MAPLLSTSQIIKVFTTLIASIFCVSAFSAMKDDNMALSNKWTEIINSGKSHTTNELMPLFLDLEPIKPEAMFGQWKGGKFDGGKPDVINWYGKRFVSREYVEPLLVTAADGSVQVFDKLGSARLREMVFGDVVSTGLIYDNQPILDYFRKINDDLIIGYGETKGDTPDFFFYLAREK